VGIFPIAAAPIRKGDCGDSPNAICFEIMPANTLVRLGHYETSFHLLHADQDRYWNKGEMDGDGHRVEPAPTKFEDGIKFGFMQTDDGHVFVRINRLVLPTPVLFIGGRHGLKGPGPAWSEIDRETTLNILADAIVANPAFRDQLLRLAF
jgi:hypothetical protein